MNFQDLMDELKQEYIESLPDKIRDIEAHYEQKDFQLLKEDFHKLKGTGKTYGLPEISLLGEAVERICLRSTGEALVVIPEALKLLRETHSKRKASQEFVITADQRFHKIQSMAQS